MARIFISSFLHFLFSSLSSFLIFSLFILHSSLSSAQARYGYAPGYAPEEQLTALGGGKNQYVQALVRFHPDDDPAIKRMKGLQVRGVRCYLRADYHQARQRRSAIIAATSQPENLIRTTYTDFNQGWNDILFEQAITIGDEPIYLGVQVYETIGTPHPIVAYAPASVPHTCIINQGKKSWQDYTDRGTLLIEALLDEQATTHYDQTAYAQNTTHPQTVAPDTDFTGELYIHNFSTQPITTLQVAMLGQGATQPTLSDITLPTPLEAYASTLLTTTLRAGTAEAMQATWTATITQTNGNPSQPSRPGVTTLHVTRDNFIRTPLIEEFTSQRCINCPQMAYYLEKALQQYGAPYVYIAHHSGFVEDAFTTEPDRQILYIFGGYSNEYNPAIMYNRAVLPGESNVIQGIRDMSPEPYLQALAAAAEMPAKAEIYLQTHDDTLNIRGRVARELTDSQLRLSAYLLEDGISPQQFPQLGLNGDPDAPQDLEQVFRHNGVILHHYNHNPAGDTLHTQTDGTFSVNYPLVDKQGFGGNARRIVALVHPTDTGNPQNNQVLNAAQIALNNADHIQPTYERQYHNNETPNTTYDIAGRQVNSNATKQGFYIQGKRKFIVK